MLKKYCLLMLIVVGIASIAQANTLAVSAFATNPGAVTQIPDSPSGQLFDGVFAAMPADDTNVFCNEAVGFMSPYPGQYITFYVDFGSVKPVSWVNFNYWEGNNVDADGAGPLSYICGPYGVKYSFTTQDSPNITNPADDTGWDLVDGIVEGDTFQHSAWGPHHFSHQSDISAAGSVQWRWMRIEVEPINSVYGSRLFVMDELEIGDGSYVTIFAEPQPAVTTLGGTASFTVDAYSYTALSYQWKKNGVDLSDGENISGVATATLQISNAQFADQGNYTCLVTSISDPVGVESAPAGLTVLPATYPYYLTYYPAHAEIPDDPYGQLMDGIKAATGTAPDCAEAVGYLIPTNQKQTIWADLGQIKGLSLVRVSYWSWNIGTPRYINEPMPMVLEFSSSTNPNVTDPANTTDWSGLISDSTFPGSDWSAQHFEHVVDVSGTDARWVRMKFTPKNGAYGDRWLVFDEIEILDPNQVSDPIIITGQPQNVNTYVGEDPTFTVTATANNLQYQWRKNGLDMPGKTSATLQLNDVQRSDSGSTYSCRVYNATDEQVSSSATLTVNCWFAITGDFDGDCLVDLEDFATFASHWLDDSTTNPNP